MTDYGYPSGGGLWVNIPNDGPMLGNDQINGAAAYAEQGVKYRQGTASQRSGLSTAEKAKNPFWIDSDNGYGIYYWNGTTWLGIGRAMVKKTWKFLRSSANAVDTFPANGTFGSFVAGAIVDAPAGEYLIGANLGLYGSIVSSGNLRITANAANLTTDAEMGVSTVAQNLTYQTPFTHTGGTLTLTLLYQLGAGTGSVKRDGTNVWATYVGP